MRLSPNARNRLGDPRLVAKRDEWFRTLSDLPATAKDRPGGFSLRGRVGWPEDQDRLYADPEAFVLDALERLAAQADAGGSSEDFVPLCVEPMVYGVHFVEACFGCRVSRTEGQWHNGRLTAPVGTLERPDLEASEAWRLARRAATAFLEQEVPLPLFGMPTLAGVLNVALNLYGQDILLALLDEPEAARRDLDVIHGVLAELHGWYRRAFPPAQLQPVISWERTQPPGCGQVCGCGTQLVSAETYAEWFAPYDAALLAAYPRGGMIHLCGAHGHHIPAFRDMESLRAVQLNDRAAGELERYVAGLRPDQTIYCNPCKDMSAERASRIAAGRPLVLAGECR